MGFEIHTFNITQQDVNSNMAFVLRAYTDHHYITVTGGATPKLNISFPAGTGSGWTIPRSVNYTLIPAAGIEITGATDYGLRGLTVTAEDGAITVDGDINLSYNGSVTLNATAGVTLTDASIQTTSGTITIDADTDNNDAGDFTTTTTGTAPQIYATTSDDTITITAADIILGAGTVIDNDNGIINLYPSSNTLTVGLGSTAGNFTIDDTEIDYFGSAGDTPTINIAANHNAAVTMDGFTPSRAISMTIDADGGAGGIVNFSNSSQFIHRRCQFNR